MSSAWKLVSSAHLWREPLGASDLDITSNEQYTSCSYVYAFLIVGITILMISAVIFSSSSVALANDTMARVGWGGIEFLKNRDIKIVEEYLWISQKQIKVRYRFRNDQPKDIRATVAFPLPAHGRLYPDHQSAYIKSLYNLSRSFRVNINGKPVPTRYHRRAVVGDRDITALLRQIGLDDKEIFETFGGYRVNEDDRITWDIPKSKEAALKRVFGEMARGEQPWKVAETLLWEQNFPARKDVIVEHSYRPIPGGRYDVPYEDDHGHVRDVDESLFFHTDPCLDAPTRRTIAKKVRSYLDKGVGSLYVFQTDVEYILGTGRNWNGPIGLFRLRIEKAAPDRFISLCFPGRAKKISPTVFEFVERNFVPPDKLVVNFYKIEPRSMSSFREFTDDEASLLHAASQGYVERVKSLLDKGVDINVQSRAGWTALMWAAEADFSNVTKVLLERGARVDSKNKKGWTALKLAEKNGHKDIVAFLKAYGAKE